MRPTKLETLDDLLMQAEDYANFCLRNTGQLPPTLFLIGPDGPLTYMPQSFSGDSAKDDFAASARLICLAHAASAVVLVSEAWAKFAQPGEKLDTTEPPSEALDRREVVVLIGESSSGPKHRFLPIIRSGNGKFFGLGEAEDSGTGAMKGRFAQILPNTTPDASMRELAKAMLKLNGVSSPQAIPIPRPPRPR